MSENTEETTPNNLCDKRMIIKYIGEKCSAKNDNQSKNPKGKYITTINGVKKQTKAQCSGRKFQGGID